MSKQLLSIIAVIAVIIAIGYGMQRGTDPSVEPVNQSGTTETIASETTTAATSETGGALSTTKPKRNMYTQATLKTNQGDIVIALDTANTPKTVENFTKLAESGFYNGTKFHRIIKDFMIQGGDPLSKDDDKQAYWGTGGPGYQFDDEIKPTNSNAPGTLSMANAGPNTNGSQFFINVADNSFLNGKHTVFGKVTTGYDLVVRLSQTPTGPNDRPINPIIITSVELK